jgi:tetratricopeptide (TPR) repeat protein
MAGDETGGLDAALTPRSSIRIQKSRTTTPAVCSRRPDVWMNRAEYAQAIRLRPDSHEAHFNLGIVFASLQRLPEAIAEFRTAIRLKPDYAKAHTNLGSALALQGNLDEAIAEFSEALRLQPDMAEARKNLEYAKTLTRKK